VRLLIVEDDSALAHALADALGERGFLSDLAANLADAREMLALAQFAAIILDLGLPDGDGLSLIRDLRAAGRTLPILAVTARDAIGQRVAGLDSGADDYIVKPFAVEELTSRLNAVLRRQGAFQGMRLEYGNLALDPVSGDFLVAGSPVGLSTRERQLMELLLRRRGQVLNRRLVDDQLYGLLDPVGSNAIEVQIHRLRRKLEEAGADVRIETVRGLGYMMRLVP
jgi:two-component system response regulator TctD